MTWLWRLDGSRSDEECVREVETREHFVSSERDALVSKRHMALLYRGSIWFFVIGIAVATIMQVAARPKGVCSTDVKQQESNENIALTVLVDNPDRVPLPILFAIISKGADYETSGQAHPLRLQFNESKRCFIGHVDETNCIVWPQIQVFHENDEPNPAYEYIPEKFVETKVRLQRGVGDAEYPLGILRIRKRLPVHLALEGDALKGQWTRPMGAKGAWVTLRLRSGQPEIPMALYVPVISLYSERNTFAMDVADVRKHLLHAISEAAREREHLHLLPKSMEYGTNANGLPQLVTLLMSLDIAVGDPSSGVMRHLQSTPCKIPIRDAKTLKEIWRYLPGYRGRSQKSK